MNDKNKEAVEALREHAQKNLEALKQIEPVNYNDGCRTAYWDMRKKLDAILDAKGETS